MRALALALALLTCLARTAAAEGPAITTLQVLDPDAQVGADQLGAALRAAPVATPLGRCGVAQPLLGWVVFQGGKVVQAEVAGGRARAVERCVARALRGATLAARGRLVATVSIAPPTASAAGAEAEPGTPAAGMTLAPAPAPVVTTAPPSGDPGALTRDEISAVMRTRAGAFRGCYERELNKTPGLEGKVIVRFEIEGDGRVKNAKVAGSTVASAAVGTCLVEALVRTPFPAKGAVTSVTYPFVFATK